MRRCGIGAVHQVTRGVLAVTGKHTPRPRGSASAVLEYPSLFPANSNRYYCHSATVAGGTGDPGVVVVGALRGVLVGSQGGGSRYDTPTQPTIPPRCNSAPDPSAPILSHHHVFSLALSTRRLTHKKGVEQLGGCSSRI